MLGSIPDLVKPGRPEQVPGFAVGQVRDGLLRKVPVGAVTLTVDGRSAPKLLDLYLRGLKGGRRARGSASTLLGAIAPNAEAVRDSLLSSVKAGSASPTARPATTGSVP